MNAGKVRPVMNAGRRAVVIAVLVIAALVSAGFVSGALRTERVERQLLELPADAVAADESLVAFATERGPYLFVENCASCHGADMRGDAESGAPDLQDSVWLYGEGKISDIENTIQYGIRSGHPKAHNVTDMPGYLRSGQLSAAEVNDVVEYMLSISKQTHDAAAARRGADWYANKGNCFDCHGSDALGNPDYGAPALTGPAWMYGGSRAHLLKSVADGRHGLCPAWINTLSPADVRELAVYLYEVAHHGAPRPDK
jgi:cytochrome c oxidase cbb3-type subunit 3